MLTAQLFVLLFVFIFYCIKLLCAKYFIKKCDCNDKMLKKLSNVYMIMIINQNYI